MARRGWVLVLSLVAFAAVACVGQDVTVPPGGSGLGSVVVTLTEEAGHSTAVLEFHGGEQLGGNHCWTPDDAPPGEHCTDMRLPASPFRYTDIPRATTLELRGNATSASGSLHLVETSRTGPPSAGPELALDLADGSVALDVPGGEYILQIVASFPQDRRSFTFAIHIV
jgi:hypothetical protein